MLEPKIANQKSIMFIDDDDQLLKVLALRTEQAGFKAITAHNLLTAISLFTQAEPDLICVDVNLPSGNGLDMCELIRSELRDRSVPLIVLSGQTDDETLTTSQQLGARFIKKSPDVWQTLHQAITELLGQKGIQDTNGQRVPAQVGGSDASQGSEQADIVDAVFAMLGADVDLTLEAGLTEDPSGSFNTEAPAESTGSESAYEESPHAGVREHRPWVLLIEDDQDVSLAVKLRLEKSGIAVARAFEGLEGVKQAFSRPAEAIILDFNLPNGQGDYVLRRLKSNPLTRDIPVIVVTGVRDQSLEQKMLSLGACRFLTKPIDFDCLNEELQKHVALQAV